MTCGTRSAACETPGERRKAENVSGTNGTASCCKRSSVHAADSSSALASWRGLVSSCRILSRRLFARGSLRPGRCPTLIVIWWAKNNSHRPASTPRIALDNHRLPNSREAQAAARAAAVLCGLEHGFAEQVVNQQARPQLGSHHGRRLGPQDIHPQRAFDCAEIQLHAPAAAINACQPTFDLSGRAIIGGHLRRKSSNFEP